MENIVLLKICKRCKESIAINVTKDQLYLLTLPRCDRPLIQNILPNHTPQDREMFLSGLFGKCWTWLFKGVEQ